MNEKEKRIRALGDLIRSGSNIARLKESEEWNEVLDVMSVEIETAIRTMIKPDTTPDEYINLRADVNARIKLLDALDARMARGTTASKQREAIN